MGKPSTNGGRYATAITNTRRWIAWFSPRSFAYLDQCECGRDPSPCHPERPNRREPSLWEWRLKPRLQKTQIPTCEGIGCRADTAGWMAVWGLDGSGVGARREGLRLHAIFDPAVPLRMRRTMARPRQPARRKGRTTPRRISGARRPTAGGWLTVARGRVWLDHEGGWPGACLLR